MPAICSCFPGEKVNFRGKDGSHIIPVFYQTLCYIRPHSSVVVLRQNLSLRFSCTFFGAMIAERVKRLDKSNLVGEQFLQTISY